MPAIKQIVQKMFGLLPSTSINADEGMAKGCELQAAAQSNQFFTKAFSIQEMVTNGVEAVFVHDGKQEKVVINDEGYSASTERMVNITADLPFSLALQYVENVNIENK